MNATAKYAANITAMEKIKKKRYDKRRVLSGKYKINSIILDVRYLNIFFSDTIFFMRRNRKTFVKLVI